jgi:hypothetical protein
MLYLLPACSQVWAMLGSVFLTGKLLPCHALHWCLFASWDSVQRFNLRFNSGLAVSDHAAKLLDNDLGMELNQLRTQTLCCTLLGWSASSLFGGALSCMLRPPSVCSGGHLSCMPLGSLCMLGGPLVLHALRLPLYIYSTQLPCSCSSRHWQPPAVSAMAKQTVLEIILPLTTYL